MYGNVRLVWGYAGRGKASKGVYLMTSNTNEGWHRKNKAYLWQVKTLRYKAYLMTIISKTTTGWCSNKKGHI